MTNFFTIALFATVAVFGVTADVAQAATAPSQTVFSLEGVSSVPSEVVHVGSLAWPFSWFIDSLLSQGVTADIIYLILAVPFIAFIIAFFRQFVGVSTFGVYTPLLITLAYLLLGIVFGLGVLLMIIVISYLLRNIIGKLNLLYIPRTGFLISCIALSFFIVIWFALNFGSPVAIGVAIFPMLLMSTISERINSAQLEEGVTEAFKGVVQTLIVSVIAYYFVIWPVIMNTTMAYPEFVVFPLLATLLLGKFSGLRLIEYFRFRALFKEQIEEE